MGVIFIHIHACHPHPNLPPKRGRGRHVKSSELQKPFHHRDTETQRHRGTEKSKHYQIRHSPPLLRGRARACPVLDTGQGVIFVNIQAFHPHPNLPPKRGRGRHVKRSELQKPFHHTDTETQRHRGTEESKTTTHRHSERSEESIR